jgi:hypothetical protein
MRHGQNGIESRGCRLALAAALLQQLQGISIIALPERDPAQRIGKVRVVRERRAGSLRQVQRLVDLVEALGISNGKIVFKAIALLPLMASSFS